MDDEILPGDKRDFLSQTVMFGVLGDQEPDSEDRIAIDRTFETFAKVVVIDREWIGTKAVEEGGTAVLEKYAGLWLAPGDPCAGSEAFVAAAEYARRNGIPLLATGFGFRHVVEEFAKNVLHAAVSPFSGDPDIFPSPKPATVNIRRDTLASLLYDADQSEETATCGYAMDPAFREGLEGTDLVISGVDERGRAMIAEHADRKFYVGTVFSPHPANDPAELPPILHGFIRKGCMLHLRRFLDSL
jgi:CTP synthase (UTP-ammonia lyase)